MSNDRFSLKGTYGIEPSSGDPPNVIRGSAKLEEIETISRKVVTQLTLEDDNPHAINLEDLTGVNFLILRATGDKVRARVTSADGALQAHPIDPLLILISKSVPITAIDLTRAAGSATTVTVEIFLGQS